MCSTCGIQTDIFWSLGSSLVLLLSWFRQAQLWQSKANFPDLFCHSIKQVNLIWCKETSATLPSESALIQILKWTGASLLIRFEDLLKCILATYVLTLQFSGPWWWRQTRVRVPWKTNVFTIKLYLLNFDSYGNTLLRWLPLVFLISCATCYVIAQPVTVFLPSSRTLWSSNKHVQHVFSSTLLLAIMFIREG